MLRRFLIIATVGMLLSMPAASEPSENDRPQLSPAQRAQFAAKLAVSNRNNYASQLERNLLSLGIDVSVFTLEKDGPLLVIMGYINKPFVYNAISKLDVLRQAKSAGFKRVEFMDKGPDGRWIFDISKPTLPRCDIVPRMCL